MLNYQRVTHHYHHFMAACDFLYIHLVSSKTTPQTGSEHRSLEAMTRHAAREAAQGARRVDHGLIPQEDETMVLYGYIMMVNIMMIDNG
jgi:hypothetical protein